jgi:hypothetical protein
MGRWYAATGPRAQTAESLPTDRTSTPLGSLHTQSPGTPMLNCAHFGVLNGLRTRHAQAMQNTQVARGRGHPNGRVMARLAVQSPSR